MNIGFDKISPTPKYPLGINAAQLSSYDWSSKAGVVLQFKTALKADLRTAQLGRCCYCRRILFDDISTHIEHFIEKAHYPLFTFEIRNLALSCGTCNTQKNGNNKLLLSLIKKRAERQGKAPLSRCPTLAQELSPNATLPSDPQHYRWVHPHLDKYSENIQIEKGWIFVGKTLKGSRTIRGVSLNALAQIERRALFERLATRGGMLSILVGFISELEQHKAKEVAAVLARVLRHRRNLPSP
ncbi:hypothetical protein [Thauera sp. WH-1]|uniref:hypothetical protein n=1 Tax=Thauera sp. WH-1 TaxID=3398230 RepID=UPI0039FBC3C2